MKSGLEKIKKEDAFLIKNYHLPKISEEEWNSIYYHMDTYFIDDSINKEIEYLRYPGFVFSNDEVADYYYENYYSKLKEYGAYTFPRGNITSQAESMTIGIKPGRFYDNYLKIDAQPAWLMGPSSKMLHDLYDKIKVYSYFTNYYTNKYESLSDTSTDFHLILDEIKTIKYIRKNIYNKDSLVIFFLGSYREYESLCRRIESEEINKDFNIRAYRIWHPAYLVRAYTQEKFDKWAKNLLNIQLL